MKKINKKKAQESEFDSSDEEESAGATNVKDSSDSHNQQSFESSDEYFQIDVQEETSMKSQVLEPFHV